MNDNINLNNLLNGRINTVTDEEVSKTIADALEKAELNIPAKPNRLPPRQHINPFKTIRGD